MLRRVLPVLLAMISPVMPAFGSDNGAIADGTFPNGVLPIVTEHYPPYEFDKPLADGRQGFDYDVAVEAFAMMGYKAEIEFLPWKRAMAYTRRGSVAGVLTCAITDERSGFITYSKPISRFTNGFYVRKGFDGPVPMTLSDLKGQKTGSVTGYESLQALKDAGLNPIAGSDNVGALRMLNVSRIDYLYLNRESTNFFIQNNDMSGKFDFHPMIAKPFHMCFSKAWPGVEVLKAGFDKALSKMRDNGRYDEIHAWYGE